MDGARDADTRIEEGVVALPGNEENVAAAEISLLQEK